MSSGFHVGTLLLFAAASLLVIASVSAPLWHTMGFLKVNYRVGGSPIELVFGTFGYCVRGPTETLCTSRHIGYNIAEIISSVGGQPFSSSTTTTLNNLTKGLILHPIGAGIAGIAFLIALCAHRIGFLFSSLIAAVGSIVVAVAVVFDFVAFSIARRHVNDIRAAGTHATYGIVIWLTLGAGVALILGSVTVCCGCFTDRRRKHRSRY
ncbi:hypothetical protein BS47DRAFT_563719 [Hydnum rufescens UP504]|uniref:Pali-domain-containing protein n=1 Tax=Hydnum rufescens UP504 TaxID=1448309 RepID=A0A9P6AG27_9AGAM|nr:hypothetical protein BS47DRAFT_563719 [Hydnum rufescens UP504]